MGRWETLEDWKNALLDMEENGVESRGAQMFLKNRIEDGVKEAADVLLGTPEAKMTARLIYLTMLKEAEAFRVKLGLRNVPLKIDMAEYRDANREADRIAEMKFHEKYIESIKEEVTVAKARSKARWIAEDMEGLNMEQLQEEWQVLKDRVSKIFE